MKKSVSVFFCLVLLLTMLTGCGRSTNNDVQPGDTDTTRPDVNDNVVTNDNDNIVDPDVTDNSLTGDIQEGVDNAGVAVERGMENVGDAVNDAADHLVGNNNDNRK